MASSQIRLKIKFPFWAGAYICAIKCIYTACKATGIDYKPDLKAASFRIAKHTRVVKV